MDAKAAKKALYRAKLKDAQREKRIDSPLVRYNELDQPVCRVCDVILKSETLWAAHQASRKHHEAIKNVKATAAGLTKMNNAKSSPPIEFTDKPRSTSTLPADFFDKHDAKKQKLGTVSQREAANVSGNRLESFDSEKRINESNHSRVVDAKGRSEIKPSFQPAHTMRTLSGPEIKAMKGALPEGFFDKKDEGFFDKKDAESRIQTDNSAVKLLKRVHPEGFFNDKDSETSKQNNGSEAKQLKGALPEGFFDNTRSGTTGKMGDSDVKLVKGALPEGFFDNKDADLRARGIEPVKIDIKDEYKEFEKVIQEDLHVVDERFEEEEIDAADIREGEESLEQNSYRERVEMLKKQQMEFKKKQMELKAARFGGKKGADMKKDSSDEESSSDEDDNEKSFTVDWRAKRF